MGSFKIRAVGIAMIAALAGTPAALAACAALCIPEMAHGSFTTAADKADPHATHGSMPASRATTDENDTHASGHHDLGAQQSEGSHGDTREGVLEMAVASNRSCCTSDDIVLTASVAAVRADAGALLATVAVFATPFHLLVLRRSEPRYSPPIAPPSSTRVPLVLRV